LPCETCSNAGINIYKHNLLVRSMRLSKNEIKTLVNLASSKDSVSPKSLSDSLKFKSNSIYKIIIGLEKKGLVRRFATGISLSITQQSEYFKKFYYAHKAAPLEHIIMGRRIELISALDANFKTIDELNKLTSIKQKRGKKGKLYSFNYKIWHELKNFTEEIVAYEILHNIPQGAVLIKDYGNSTLFKSISTLDATPTSFSVYKSFGIELFLKDNFYTLPKRTLSIKEIFIHSLDSAGDIASKIYCILFYLKYKYNLKNVNHPMVKKIKSVLNGNHIKGYPNLDDIIDRAELYDIKLQHFKSRRCDENLSGL
jgi:predicted transcriptional regulator